ncbi:unnamed protein product, partial [marine sediment metagenome]
MKTKTISTLITALFIVVNCYGQIPKKTIMIGGNFEMPIEINKYGTWQLKLTPSFGYFVIDNFALGLNLDTEFFIYRDYKETKLGIGPMMRYYFGQNNWKPFAHISYLPSITFRSDEEQNEFYSHLQLGAGINYLINKMIGIE